MSIDLYAARTGNGLRAAIALEEAELSYRPIKVDLRRPREASYLTLNPTGRIPTVVDHGFTPALVVTQTAAIILHVASESGRLLPTDAAARARALEWMMAFTTDVIAPSTAAFFMRMAQVPACDEALAWLEDSARRHLVFANLALEGSEYLGGGTFTVADIVAFPIVSAMKAVDWADLPHLARWSASVADRPGVKRGMRLFADHRHSSGGAGENGGKERSCGLGMAEPG